MSAAKENQETFAQNNSQIPSEAVNSQQKPDIKELFLAIQSKDTAAVNRLIAAGVDLKATYGEAKSNALHQAAGFATPGIIKILLGKIDINERDASDRTPIFYAVAGTAGSVFDSIGPRFMIPTSGVIVVFSLFMLSITKPEQIYQQFLTQSVLFSIGATFR